MKHFVDIAFYTFVKRNSSRVQIIDLLVNFGALFKINGLYKANLLASSLSTATDKN